MIYIDFNRLTPLEKKIHNTLLSYSREHDNITIIEAATINNCSVSKISKLVKKLGFKNYKQYVAFLYGKDLSEISHTGYFNELERIKKFIDDFDMTLVQKTVKLINSHSKIILFGYGPSFLCAEYFEYKLRITTNCFAMAAPDEVSIENLIDGDSLLFIFTATGKFASFENIYKMCKGHNCKVVIITEEYNDSLVSCCDELIWLCKYKQPDYLKPHEKTRTVFFIFIEEVIQQIIHNNLQTSDNKELI
ncbi:MurR/RpiR family transcriptional regulator [Thermovenabulum sp.]|uniref:MurR/RpiR family transcriptional regulator n=1 Tax=Thermovenabulum sp. TaxID=3100335 RepID=UPI003C7BB27E